MATVDEMNSLLSDEQRRILEENFKAIKYPDGTSLMLIAAEVGVSEQDVEKWYKLRMAKWRMEEGLPSAIGSVLD